MSNEQILDQIRNWLKQGASITINDPTKEPLIQSEDGSWFGNVTVKLPPEKFIGGFENTISHMDITGTWP